MTYDRRSWRERIALAQEIAPFRHEWEDRYRLHEGAEDANSAGALHAIARALPEGWDIGWVMTGGGCSGWQIDGPSGTPFSVLVTGLDDGEASGDLRWGAVVGAYDHEGAPWGEDTYDEVTSADPLEIARMVARFVAEVAR